MTVVLFLLKLAGILLLVLVGIIVLLSMALLLVPVRYRISGEAAQELSASSVRIRVSWLFHLIHFQLVFEKKELAGRLRILGIPIGLGGKAKAEEGESGKQKRKESKGRKAKRQKKRRNRRHAKRQEETAEQERAQPAEIKERKAEVEKRRTESEEKKEEIKEKKTEESAEQKTAEAQNSSGRETTLPSKRKRSKRDKHPSFSDKIQGIFSMIRDKWETLKEMVRRIGARLQALWEQAGSVKALLARIREEIHREENRRALKAVLREIKYLIRHIGPRKIFMQLLFGTTDPAMTGQLLGLISTFPFVYRYQIQISPDFSSESFYLKGPFDIKGHARGVHAVLSAFCLIRDKNIRGILHRYRNS